MNHALKRWVASVLLAALAFTHASVSFAACPLERGHLGTVMTSKAEPCRDDLSVTGFESLYANRCVAHCTSDLQLAGDAVAMVRSPGDAPVLVLPPAPIARKPRLLAEDSPPGEVPIRILLHSFLI